MAILDVIARLYISGLVDGWESKHIKTSSAYSPVPARPQHSDQRSDQRDYTRRQSTEPPEDSIPLRDKPCIEIRFSNIPRSRHGVVFGSDPRSDIAVFVRGVSFHHFTLTFDDVGHLIVKDWGSRFGTGVTYNESGKGKRSDFHWIVGGHEVLKEMNPIVIHLTGTIKFQIVMADHKMESPVYMDKVNRFKQGTGTAENLFQDLEFAAETRRPTGEHTPGQGEIHLQKEVGQGAFGCVTHFWNVSTGKEWAAKRPPLQNIRERDFDTDAWMHEAHVMSLISHPHVIQLFHAEFKPFPQLNMEFMRGGSLDAHRGLKISESVSILRQCLSALQYLHESDPPIVHRDIKPSNILVQFRTSDQIHVKLGDFGASKDDADLSSIVGCWEFSAPEMYQIVEREENGEQGRLTYTAAVDVWSLGVVVYELLCPLPNYRESYNTSGTRWCKKLIHKFEEDRKKKPHELKNFLLEVMLILSPNFRPSASECFDRANLLFEAFKNDHQIFKPTSSNDDEMQRRGLDRVNNDDFDSRQISAQQTIRERPTEDLKPRASRGKPFMRQNIDLMGTESASHSPSTENDFGNLANNNRVPEEWEELVNWDALDEYNNAVSQGAAKVDNSPFADKQSRIREPPTSNLSGKSHLSTRDLLFDQEGLICMVIRQRRISMRASDFELNARQILLAGTSSGSKRARILAQLKSRGVEGQISNHNDDVWVSFRDGVFLCQAVGLEKDLAPLLSYSPLPYPNRDENYLLPEDKGSWMIKSGFATVSFGDHLIAYRPADRTVNATHLLKLGDISRRSLTTFFKASSGIHKDVQFGHPSVSGTYISFEDAVNLCMYYGINPAPVRDLMAKDGSAS